MHFHCGLGADKETSADLALFAKDRFRRVVGKQGRGQNAFDSTDKISLFSNGVHCLSFAE